MDLSIRRMAKIPETIMAPYEAASSLRLPKVARPDKVTATDEWRENHYQVRYFDIDYNGHVNNARYFDWMLDTLDHDFLQKHQIVEIRMNYEHEVRPQTVVNSLAITLENNEQEWTTQHQIWVGTQKCATATIKWQ